MGMKISEMDDNCLIGLMSERLRKKAEVEQLNAVYAKKSDILVEASCKMLDLIKSLRKSLSNRGWMELVDKIDKDMHEVPTSFLLEAPSNV